MQFAPANGHSVLLCRWLREFGVGLQKESVHVSFYFWRQSAGSRIRFRA